MKYVLNWQKVENEEDTVLFINIGDHWSVEWADVGDTESCGTLNRKAARSPELPIVKHWGHK